MADERAFEAEREVGKIHAFFPILPTLGNQWAAHRPWEGLTIGLNLHLTTLTAALVRELALGGGRFVVSAANPHTTDPGSVELLRNLAFDVFTGGDMRDPREQVLEQQPDLLVDVGFDLIQTQLNSRRPSRVRGAVEITRSGVHRLRNYSASLPFPVVNINDGRLKAAVENRHGVGVGVWQAVTTLTGMHLAGRRVLVIGYGAVGAGIAAYAKAAGTSVEVVENDPIRRLFAHYDGFPTPALEEGVSRAAIIVTATGRPNVLTVEHLLAHARSGVLLLNAGHGGDEIDVVGIERSAARMDHVAEQVTRYRLENGVRVTLLGQGHPLNIVLNSGSPEPVLLHFAVLGLTLEWLAGAQGLPHGEVRVPEDIECQAARAALAAIDPSQEPAARGH
jgi:adenosylhomocysteinase